MVDKQLSIYTRISDNISNLIISPNQVLKERDLANEHNTSRTTIREILQRLARENKIIINPRSKTIITKINSQKIKESFLLRECLEQTVASLILKKIKTKDLICLNNNIEKQQKLLKNYNKRQNKKYIILDNEFHEYLFKIAGLKGFWKIVSEYNFDFGRLRHLAATDVNRAKESTKEHSNILLAIKEKKINNIKKAMKNHFNNAGKYYKKLIKLNPNFID